MSDAGRKDLTDKVSDKMTPEHDKSITDKISDNVTGAADKIQRDLIPDSSKSTTQSASDKVSREKDHPETHGEGIVDKAKHMVGMDKHDEKH